jgi:hypothetical protein
MHCFAWAPWSAQHSRLVAAILLASAVSSGCGSGRSAIDPAREEFSNKVQDLRKQGKSLIEIRRIFSKQEGKLKSLSKKKSSKPARGPRR